MTHEANCNYWTDHDEVDCTCGITWKTRWQTEREMYRAWRKRAEEAEAVVAVCEEINLKLQAENAKLRACVELYADERSWDSTKHNLFVAGLRGKIPAQKCLEDLK